MAGTAEFQLKTKRWKLLREWNGTDDPDWADDVSEADPTDLGTAPFHRSVSLGTMKAFEFMVIPVSSADVPVDRASGDFIYALTEVVTITPDMGSSIAVDTTVRVDLTPVSGALFNRKHRVVLNGAEAFALRLYTLQNAPAGADAYEVFWREIDA